MIKTISKDKQIKIGAILSYAAIGVNILSALIYSPWMLSKIGSGDYGLYTLASSLINMFLLDFGISASVSRFTSKYLAEENQEKVNELLAVIYKLFFVISFIVAICLIGVYFFIDHIYVALTPNELVRFKNVYIIAASYSVLSFPFVATVNGILTSYELFVQMKACDFINKIVTVLCVIVFLLSGYGLYALVAVNAIVNIITLLIKVLMISKNTMIKIDFKFWDKDLLKEVFGFSVWVLINSICSRLIMNLCPNILGMTAGTLAITIFSFASTIEGYVYIFSSAIDGMFMPRIARIIYKEGNIDKILDLMIKVGKYQFALTMLLVIGFSLVGKQFISLWLGAGYSDVYYCSLLLLIPAPFYLSQQIGKNAMVMTNNVKYLTVVNIAKAAVNVILVYILSKKMGSLGACLSISVVYLGRNLANMILYKKVLKINIRTFIKQCYIKYILPIIITLVIGFLNNIFIKDTGWIILGVKIILIVIIYALVIWTFIVSKTNKQKIIEKIFKINGERY